VFDKNRTSIDGCFMDRSVGEGFQASSGRSPVENDGFLSHTSMAELFITFFLVEYISLVLDVYMYTLYISV